MRLFLFEQNMSSVFKKKIFTQPCSVPKKNLSNFLVIFHI